MSVKDLFPKKKPAELSSLYEHAKEAGDEVEFIQSASEISMALYREVQYFNNDVMLAGERILSGKPTECDFVDNRNRLKIILACDAGVRGEWRGLMEWFEDPFGKDDWQEIYRPDCIESLSLLKDMMSIATRVIHDVHDHLNHPKTGELVQRVRRREQADAMNIMIVVHIVYELMDGTYYSSDKDTLSQQKVYLYQHIRDAFVRDNDKNIAYPIGFNERCRALFTQFRRDFADRMMYELAKMIQREDSELANYIRRVSSAEFKDPEYKKCIADINDIVFNVLDDPSAGFSQMIDNFGDDGQFTEKSVTMIKNIVENRYLETLAKRFEREDSNPDAQE